jgi:hypothetical protein
MKNKRLLTWMLVAAGIWSTGFVYNVFIGGYPGWLREMYGRKVALAQEIDQPKIIIAGGSGAHYTINSDVMADELGVPVINFGTNGGIGLNVLLPSVLDQVNPGDTMLLIPEYPLLLTDDGLDDLSASFGMMIGRPGLGGVPAHDLAHNFLQLGVPSLQALVRTGQDVVREGRFDYYGDPLTQRGDATIEIPRQTDWWKMRIRSQVSDYAVERLQQFADEVEARGGTLVLSLPWLYGSTEEETVNNVQATADALSEIAVTLYDPETLNIQTDSDLFADTHYHLKISARVLRSQQLVEELQASVPAFQPTASEATQ